MTDDKKNLYNVLNNPDAACAAEAVAKARDFGELEFKGIKDKTSQRRSFVDPMAKRHGGKETEYEFQDPHVEGEKGTVKVSIWPDGYSRAENTQEDAKNLNSLAIDRDPKKPNISDAYIENYKNAGESTLLYKGEVTVNHSGKNETTSQPAKKALDVLKNCKLTS